MVRRCCSARRCGSIACAGCAWRYSLHISRRIQAVHPRRLHTVAIGRSTYDPSEFRQKRKSIHNSVAYQRRRCSWWNDFGLWLWLTGDRLVGFAEFGSITPEEFECTFQRHGAVSACPIDIPFVRVEVYRAALMSSLPIAVEHGRYQALRIAIEPVALPVLPISPDTERVVQPMPVLL